MGLPQAIIQMTPVEFLAWEEVQPDKHEFVDGEIFAMGGARRIHNAISGNCYAALKAHLRGGPCHTYINDMRVQVAENIYYPDVLVTCHPQDLAADLVMHHPKVIIEILSESTSAYDRGAKFAAYRCIEALEEYALIDPDARGIEVFRRTGGDWLLATSEAGRGLILKSIDFAITPEVVFENV